MEMRIVRHVVVPYGSEGIRQRLGCRPVGKGDLLD